MVPSNKDCMSATTWHAPLHLHLQVPSPPTPSVKLHSERSMSQATTWLSLWLAAALAANVAASPASGASTPSSTGHTRARSCGQVGGQGWQGRVCR